MKFIIKLPAYLFIDDCFYLQEGKLEAEAFTEQLYDTLKSTPQPCLVPFLKVLRSVLLPHLVLAFKPPDV